MKIQIKELVSVWAMSEASQDRKQLTLRLDTDSYVKLHALKDLFNRPVNEMINDLVKVGLEEVISNLPRSFFTESEPEYGIRAGDEYGVNKDFQQIYSKLKSELESKVELQEAA